jgi:hypothetical protein
MLEVTSGEHRMGKTQVSEWFSMFKSGVTSVEDTECSVGPQTNTTDEDEDCVKKLVLKKQKNHHQ